MSAVQPINEQTVIGLSELVTIQKGRKSKEVTARIDTGATKGSIDMAIVEELGLGPIKGEKTVRNAHGSAKRQIIDIKFTIAGKTFTEEFTVANREHLRFPLLIGRNVLRKGFVIDPNRRIKKTDSAEHKQ